MHVSVRKSSKLLNESTVMANSIKPEKSVVLLTVWKWDCLYAGDGVWLD